MKTNNLFLLSILLLAGLFVSCKKDLFDYRNKYTDDYNFTVTTQNWNINDTNVYVNTSNIAGRIEKGVSESTLIIYLGSDPTITVQVNGEGNLFYPCASMSVGTNIGVINKNDMTLEYKTSTCGGGMGGGINYTITGQKD